MGCEGSQLGLGPVRVPGIGSAPLPKLKAYALKTKSSVLDMGAERTRCSAALGAMSRPPYGVTAVNCLVSFSAFFAIVHPYWVLHSFVYYTILLIWNLHGKIEAQILSQHL